MKKIIALMLAAFVAAVLALPASAAPAIKTLGEDPANDAPPALDLTYLQAGTSGKNLEIRIGIANMLPGIGGYPQAPGIEWSFKSGARTFLAEAYVDNTEGAFLLYEIKGDTFEEMGNIEGTYDQADGYISMLVPLKKIGAKKGTKLAGSGENDVDAHVHHAGTTYTDYITTTKAITVP
jgi:hypothetical protein